MAIEQDATATNDIDDSESSSLLAALTERAKVLLAELEAYRQRLQELRQDGNVEMGHFRGTVKSELNMLQKLEQKPGGQQTQHVARSSNLPFLENVWATVKRSRDIVSLQKRIYVSSDIKLLSQGMRQVDLGNSKKKREKGSKDVAVLVDAITDGGRIWAKVSLITNTRIIFDLAKQGWNSGGSDDEEYNSNFGCDDEDDDGDIPLLKTAKDLTKAAQAFRSKTKKVEVHLILPRLEPGKTPEIDEVLEKCRATGAILFCGEDVKPAPELEQALHTMAPDPIDSFSDVVNIDCTILLAVVSEFSHAKVSKEPWFHAALRRQVEIEGNENLLPSLLYPAMGSRKLVCTKEAIKRMREIVDTIGTASEKARTAIMMGDDKSKSQAELVAEMQEWSAYPVPEQWQLPIRIADQLDETTASQVALECTRSMTAINRSVFLYGWQAGCTTITSNRTVVKQMETELDRYEDLADTLWPSIWLCPTARSLVGKEKRGMNLAAEKKKHDVWPLPDPLRREQQRRNGLDVLSLREGYEVEDLRKNGYDYSDVIAAKNASQR
ncbi:Hypothetical protein R9X50_00483500 [Acrodontium crateriforme]|uniref:DUF1308 domain-containing protein n=1 Tax=Acrodontium crateriforme TaxID=150365 RepID=A0AAQ3RAF4_9PEZI|nr:Hypothetical protein R9X50_00483500 [Acrodontium crateriforme]